MALVSLFQRLGRLWLGEEGEVLVRQSHTRYTLLDYMRARRISTACSNLLLMALAVDLHDSIVTAVTPLPLFPKPSFPFGENKQKPLV